jgi:hypothetical protein
MAELVSIGFRNTVAIIAFVIVFFWAAATADGQRRPSWLPAHWYRLGLCETHLNWRWNSGTYEGAFGIYYGTWDTYRRGNEPRAGYLASPKVQLRVARRIAARHSMYAWGCWRHAWVRG